MTGKDYKPVEPEQECEYCNKPLIEGCNEFGSIFDRESDMEHPCPNNENQFPPRKISDQAG
ncbi:MAG: hypothetical protein HQ512_04310 [Rhodospirillales bacterium]|nr:hypothetical protein [Rhodospirillales bacterium]